MSVHAAKRVKNRLPTRISDTRDGGAERYVLFYVPERV